MRPYVILPTQANLKSHRRATAFAFLVAFLATAVGLFFLYAGDAPRGRSPVPLLFGALALVGAVVGFRSTSTKLEQQIRQLASYGRRFEPTRVRTELMQRTKITHWHVVVVQWTDPQGKTQEALSEPFDYDPHVLLERDRIEVIADPFHPDLCLVPDSALPPRKWIRLDPSQRERVREQGGVSPLLLWITPKLLYGVILFGLAYLVLRLVNIRFGPIGWL